MSKNNKVVKYRKTFNGNIGVIIFIFIFIYMVYNIFSYMTATHISVYEVEQGTMAENNIHRGLILRDERVFSSPYTGTLNYYVKETSRVRTGGLVCSVDENGNVSRMIAEASQNTATLGTDELSELQEMITDFGISYDPGSFYNVYTFKETLSSSLNEALSLAALEDISDYTASAQVSSSFHRMTAETPGIVIYHTDGYENVTTDTFTADMFDESAYSRTVSQNARGVSAGEPVYKLILSEEWSIVFPINSGLAAELSDDNTIQIRFVKDNKKIYANYTIRQLDGQNYLILALRSSMIRYAKDRYVEVELLLAEETGLKIPNSAITEKEFFTVPIEYFMKGGDSTGDGLLVEQVTEEGELISEFVMPTIYYATDTDYYIDSEDISADDVIRRADSSATYKVGSRTASLQGVYNINKGYAVFKQIDILYQNEEYSIVQTGTTYGIALYDHIALDGSKIQENELINE